MVETGREVNPLSVYAAIALIALSVGSVGAWRLQSWRYAAKDAQRIEAQAERDRNDRKAAQSASEGFEHDKAKTAIKYRTITKEVEKIVERPIYLRECFDNSGLQLVRDALGTTVNPGEPSGTLLAP